MNRKIRVMSVFGTRPEAIKMAPLVKELEKHDDIDSIVCVTAQHREMLDQVLEIFHITPDYDLDIMKDRQTLQGITVRVLEGMTEVLEKAKPDIVLVHGDTSTTFVTALAAFYQQIPVGHVEAGLRTYNRYEPFPEEMNRKLAGSLANLHFSPTPLAKGNLLREAVEEKDIFVTGNTVIDVLNTTVQEEYAFTVEKLNNIDYKNKRVIAMTAHRRENQGEPLEHICEAVKAIAEEFDDVEVVYAVHKNPVVRDVAERILGEQANVQLIEPLDLNDMHNLMKRATLILTDSGGLQEEAPSLGKPVLVLRNVTERPEGVEAGTLRLAGVNKDTIYNMTKELLTSEEVYAQMAGAKNPFGDGAASARIVQAIRHYFLENVERPEDYK
ncbi:MAG: non-hydrolyzing UDP-N-acetylglucosamine 2-epimerase [Cellulosilyticaceae bacterium]